MQTEGRTDMTKLIITFQNFAKAPENTLVYIILNLIPTLCDRNIGPLVKHRDIHQLFLIK